MTSKSFEKIWEEFAEIYEKELEELFEPKDICMLFYDYLNYVEEINNE